MFTIQPLRDSGQAQEYPEAVFTTSHQVRDPIPAPVPATSTRLRWHGESRGLSPYVTEHEFRAVCCSPDIHAAYAITLSPSKVISQTYERLLHVHDWHHACLVLQAIEDAASDTMQAIHSVLSPLLWAGCTRRWQRGDRHGVSWNAILFDISSAQHDDRRKRRCTFLSRRKDFDESFSEAFTKRLTTTWPEWRSAIG
jgi:hypothetical protein